MKQRLRKLAIADYVTMTGIGVVLLAVWLLLRGHQEASIAVLLLSIMFDFVDGLVARKYGGSLYGPFLDSVFDVLGFVVYPIILLFIGDVDPPSLLVFVISCLFVVSAALRLADFTSSSVSDKKKGYVGMPVFYSLIAICFISVGNGWLSVAWLSIMVPSMISDRVYRKPKGAWVIVCLLVAAGYFGLYAS